MEKARFSVFFVWKEGSLCQGEADFAKWSLKEKQWGLTDSSQCSIDADFGQGDAFCVVVLAFLIYDIELGSLVLSVHTVFQGCQ